MKKNAKYLLLFLILVNTQAFGQTYSYKVKYGMVQAGAAKLAHTVESGILKSYLTIESSPWLSNLWSLSDSIVSEYIIDLGRLDKHTKAIHEGNYHRNYEVTFTDSDQVWINGKEKQVKTQGLKDIPSLLYDLSLREFKNGDTLRYQVWDGRGEGALDLLVEKVGKPSLLHPFSEAGWKLTPLTSTKKSRENRIQLAMLYSKSYPHTPLRIEINTKYGNVLMRMEKP